MGIVSRIYDYVTGNTIVAAQNNANENAFVNSINNIDTAQLVDAAITTNKIKDANVTAVKLAADAVTAASISDGAITTDKIADDAITGDKILNGEITGAKIANGTINNVDIHPAAGIEDTKLGTITTAGKVNTSALTGDYAATNITIADVGGYYTSSDVEGALQEAGASSGSGTMGHADYAYKAAGATTCGVIIPANTATNGIEISFAADITIAGGGAYQPLEVNIDGAGWTNLSPSTADNPKFRLYMGCASTNISGTISKVTAYVAADGFDSTKEIQFRFGGLWSHTSPGTLLSSNFSISVNTF